MRDSTQMTQIGLIFAEQLSLLSENQLNQRAILEVSSSTASPPLLTGSRTNSGQV